jgi:putative acetyltransferase
LVRQLRDDGLIFASVVAVIGNTLVGNAVFSRLLLTTSSASLEAVALAPVAVMPSRQRCGIGSKMINHGLEICARGGFPAVLVLGDPAYYGRFGFSHDAARKIRSPYSDAGEAWMALEFQSESLPRVATQAVYPKAFTIVD